MNATNKIKIIIAAALSVMPFQAATVSAKDTEVGITFSQVQCGYLNQDWHKVYTDMLNDGFTIVRLGAYWNRIEKEKDKYDFTELDWLVEQAKEKNVRLVLTVGMKAPRWPEYFIPAWVLKGSHINYSGDAAGNKYVRERTLKFIEMVVRHYEKEPAVRYWQVENEPMDHSGEKEWWIDENFLRDEVALVKRLDSKKRLIIINAATYPNKFLNFLVRLVAPVDSVKNAVDMCDILGLNVYPNIGHEIDSSGVCFWTKPSERVRYIKRFVDFSISNGKPVWVTELQAEPWEPGKLVHLGQEKPKTCWPGNIEITFKELASLDIETILLWGGEYWYYRKETFNDGSWLDTAIEVLKYKASKLLTLNPHVLK